MRVAHVIPRIITGSSGPSYSVPRLCRALMDKGVEIELHLTGDRPDIDPSIDVRAYPALSWPQRLGVSPKMKRGLAEAAQRCDLIHNHSLWMFANIYPEYAVRKATNCDLLVSPRGTLSDWALRRSKWRKKLLWQLGQGRVLKQASCLHATAESEYDDIRRQHLSNPVAIIPNGIDIPDNIVSSPNRTGRNVLFLSRIHPKKGVEQLIDVWNTVSHRHENWTLQIAGPVDNPYAQRLRARVDQEAIPRVRFIGEVLGRQKREVYRNADLFVLPTESENFGLVVAESLSFGVPAIVCKGAPWGGLVTNQCGWWIENTDEILRETLTNAMSMNPASHREMGLRGREWMARDFSWDAVATAMVQAYEWINSGGPSPALVRTI